jgi:hypothetical protein
MTLANQASSRPTNKLMTGVAGYAAFDILVQDAVREMWASIPVAFLTTPAVTDLAVAAIGALVAVALAYPVPDRANVER